MYIPVYYKILDREAVREFIHQNGFAVLVSQVGGRPWATHIPLIHDSDENEVEILFGHISKANLQWKGFDKDEEVLAIFS
jgi:transcriptional regulator